MVGIFVVLHSTTEHEYSVNDTLQAAVNTTTVTNAAVLCPCPLTLYNVISYYWQPLSFGRSMY